MKRTSRFCGLILAILALSCAVCAQADEKMHEVYGVLTYPDGQPAPGITITTLCDCTEGKTATDSNGAYNVSVPSCKVGSVGLGAEKGDFIVSESASLAADTGVPIRKDLVFEYACLVLGEVTDASTGAPIDGAEVAVYGSYGGHTKAGSDGTFKIRTPRRDGLELNVLEDGYVTKRIRFSAEGREVVTLPVQLKPGGVVRGRVTDSNGAPVAGICVNVLEDGVNGKSAKTNQDGQYEARGIDTDRPARVWISGIDSLSRSETVEATFAPGSMEAEADLKVERLIPRAIMGRITDENDAPVSGADVILGIATYGTDKTTTTNDKGEYRMDRVAPKASMILVQKEGFAPAFLPVEANGDLRIDTKLQKGHFAEALVVDSSGNPIPDVRVGVCANTPVLGRVYNEVYRYLYVTTTDDRGKVALKNLPLEGVVLDVYKKDYAAPWRISIRTDATDNVVELQGSPRIAGAVVDAATGEPIQRFTLNWVHQGFKTTTVSGPDGKFCVGTGDHTDFRFPNRPAFKVKVLAEGYLGELVSINSTDFPEVDYSHVIKLQKASPIRGTVVDASGKGIAGVQVTVAENGTYQGQSAAINFDANGYQQKTVTAADGSFSIDMANERTASVLLEKPGAAQLFFRKVDLTKPLTLAMLGPATVSVKAVSMAGEHTAVRLFAKLDDVFGDGFLATVTPNRDLTPDGLATLSDIQPGSYQFQVSGDMQEKWRYITIESGDKLLFDFDKPRPVTVTGTVTNGGEPARGVRVVIIQGMIPGQVEADACITDSKGRYSIAVDRPGTVRLTHSKDRSSPPYGDQSVELKRGVNTFNLRVPVPPTGSVSGRVMDGKTGSPVAGKQVLAQMTHETPRQRSYNSARPGFERSVVVSSAISGDDGAFSLKAIPSGRVSILVKDESKGVQYVGNPIVVREKKPVTGVEVKLVEAGAIDLTIVDSKTGKPVKAKTISLRTIDGVTVADSELSEPVCLPPGSYVLSVEPSDKRYLAASAKVEIKQGKTAKVIFKMNPAPQKVVLKDPKRTKLHSLR